MVFRVYTDTSVIGGCADVEFKAYNEVNYQMGYGELTIPSPKEVVYDNADED